MLSDVVEWRRSLFMWINKIKVETKPRTTRAPVLMWLISFLLETLITILFLFLRIHILRIVCVFILFVLGVVRPISRTPLGELKQANAPIDRMYK